MLGKKINSLIDGLLEAHPLFDKGWLYQEHLVEEGITDEYKNYFYFRKNGNKSTFFSDINGCDQYNISGNYYMIIALEPCIDSDVVVQGVYGFLNSKFVNDITGYNDDYEEVYENETGHKLTDECKFIRIDFRIFDDVKLGCVTKLCRENCCISEKVKTVNNSI